MHFPCRQACSADAKVSLSLSPFLFQYFRKKNIYKEIFRNDIKCNKNENRMITFAQVFGAFTLDFKALLTMIADLIPLHVWCIWESSHFPIGRTSQVLSGYCWYRVFWVSPEINLGSSLGSDWFTQGHSQTFPEGITSLCDLGNCCVWRWALSGVWFRFHHSIESNF